MDDLSSRIDLHTHTDESDGSYTPDQLITAAQDAGLRAIAITDHDTFEGYLKAKPIAEERGFDLVRGIELNSRLKTESGRIASAHVLGYFPTNEPSASLLQWLKTQREDRRQRNSRLAQSLQEKGLDITVEEVDRLGKSLAGRPHFAKLLVRKGYATDHEDAFRRFVGEDAPTFVDRQSPQTEQVLELIRNGGGIPVIAHPIRLSLTHDAVERRMISRLKDAGLIGLEIIHSEHSPELQAYYGALAAEFQLLPSGGSDFHGAIKPDTQLGAGRNGNVAVPHAFLQQMRAFRLDLVGTKS